MAHLLLLARYFPKLLAFTKTAIIQGLRIHLKKKFFRVKQNATKMSNFCRRSNKCRRVNPHFSQEIYCDAKSAHACRVALPQTPRRTYRYIENF